MQTASLREIRASGELEMLTIFTLVGLLVVKEVVARSERRYARTLDRVLTIALIPVLIVFLINLLVRLGNLLN